MPVTIRPATHASTTFTGRRYRLAAGPEELLLHTLTDDLDDGPSTALHIVQSAFTAPFLDFKLDKTAGSSDSNNARSAIGDGESEVYATKNGLVHTCLEAYNTHHRLVLRPEDVWFAILAQFASYVNARAETDSSLREIFVEPNETTDGISPTQTKKKELHIEVDITDTTDHGALAFEMTKLIQSQIRDAGLRDWILPAFTTTTKVDQATASMLLMGATQRFFAFSWGTRCGLPSVTLLGEKADWVKIRQRVERLEKYGDEPRRWLGVLRPALDGFVTSFEEPEGERTLRFWRGICDEYRPNGSGRVTYSGWITAFCFWDAEGRCLHDGPRDGGHRRTGIPGMGLGMGSAVLKEGVHLSRADVPPGFCKVPLTLWYGGIPVPSEIVAGSFGIRVFREQVRGRLRKAEEEGVAEKDESGLDTTQPLAGWILYHKPAPQEDTHIAL